MPPSAFLLRKKKKQRHWEPWDYGLAEAIHMIDNEKCRKCGVPVWKGCSENSDIQFQIEEHHCYSCAYLEQHEDSKPEKEQKKFGVTEFVEAVHADTELKGINPEDVPEIDWRYRVEFYTGKMPD